MQTSDVKLLMAEYQGLVANPILAVISLIKAEHLDAASLLASTALKGLDLFSEKLEAFGAAAVDKPAAEPITHHENPTTM